MPVNVIIIAVNLFILFRIKKFTTGCSNMEIIIENTRGTKIVCAIYKIANKANIPMINIVAFI